MFQCVFAEILLVVGNMQNKSNGGEMESSNRKERRGREVEMRIGEKCKAWKRSVEKEGERKSNKERKRERRGDQKQ